MGKKGYHARLQAAEGLRRRIHARKLAVSWALEKKVKIKFGTGNPVSHASKNWARGFLKDLLAHPDCPQSSVVEYGRDVSNAQRIINRLSPRYPTIVMPTAPVKVQWQGQGTPPGSKTTSKPKRVKERAGDKYRTKKADPFYDSDAWKELRYRVLTHYGAACQCCGATRADKVKLHVDHIKPRSKFPELALVFENLQILCEDCNLGKGAKDQTDWRPKLTVVS